MNQVSKVASCDIGGQTIRFYLSPAGFEKPGHTAPCAAYLIKGVPDDSKIPPLLVAHTENAVVKFAVACLGLYMCRKLSCCDVAGHGRVQSCRTGTQVEVHMCYHMLRAEREHVQTVKAATCRLHADLSVGVVY